jgi:hypothetical protein
MPEELGDVMKKVLAKDRNERYSSAVAFAPMCKLSPEPPLITETNRTCSQGVPYTTYEIPKGATFEPLDSEFKCALVGDREGNDLIACTGKPLFAFDLKVCMPVVAPVLNMDSGQCAAGTGFDKANQCCAPVPADDAGCVIFKAGTTGC